MKSASRSPRRNGRGWLRRATSIPRLTRHTCLAVTISVPTKKICAKRSDTSSGPFNWLPITPPLMPGCPMRGCNEAPGERKTKKKWRHLQPRSEEHTSELQSPDHLVCRLLLEKKKKKEYQQIV